MKKAVRKDKNNRTLREGEFQLKDSGRYKYRWTDNNGIRHTVYADTLNELRRKEDQIAKERIEGICRSGITVAEQVKMYLEVKANLKNSTFENYYYYEEHCIRNIKKI